MPDLGFRELGIEWEAQAASGDPFSSRKRPWLVTERLIRGLKMDRHRVVQARLDALSKKALANTVAVLDLNDIEMIHGKHMRGVTGTHDPWEMFESLIVEERVLATLGVPLVKAAEFDSENRGLEGVKTPVVTNVVVGVPCRLTVVSQEANLSRALFA